MLLRRTKSTPFKGDVYSKGQANKIRISVFGFGRVGKTALIKRFLFNMFEDRYKQTIEDDYRQVLEYNNQVCDVTILDTAGSYQFPAMRKLAIENSQGFVLVFAVDDRESFDEVKRLRRIITDTKGDTRVPTVIVGNKTDLHDRAVRREDITAFISREDSIDYFETSAKRGENVESPFTNLIKVVEAKKQEAQGLLAQKQRKEDDLKRERANRLTINYVNDVTPDRRRRKMGASRMSINTAGRNLFQDDD